MKIVPLTLAIFHAEFVDILYCPIKKCSIQRLDSDRSVSMTATFYSGPIETICTDIVPLSYGIQDIWSNKKVLYTRT